MMGEEGGIARRWPKMQADHLVSCISIVALRQVAVKPAWPETNKDKISPNWAPPDPRLNELWSMAEEVNTSRGILIGGARGGASPFSALAEFQRDTTEALFLMNCVIVSRCAIFYLSLSA